METLRICNRRNHPSKFVYQWDEYVTPEGKFDVTLVGRSRFDTGAKRVVKEFITNEDEFTSSPKSPYGMFEDLYIPNDLGLVVSRVNEYYNK